MNTELIMQQAVKKFTQRLDTGWAYHIARTQTGIDFNISGLDIEDNYLKGNQDEKEMEIPKNSCK